MRILILGINFTPELTGIGKYTGELAQYLTGQGHQVHVVTAPPYYPHWRIAHGYRAWAYRQEDHCRCLGLSLPAVGAAPSRGIQPPGSPGFFCPLQLPHHACPVPLEASPGIVHCSRYCQRTDSLADCSPGWLQSLAAHPGFRAGCCLKPQNAARLGLGRKNPADEESQPCSTVLTIFPPFPGACLPAWHTRVCRLLKPHC